MFTLKEFFEENERELIFHEMPVKHCFKKITHIKCAHCFLPDPLIPINVLQSVFRIRDSGACPFCLCLRGIGCSFPSQGLGTQMLSFILCCLPAMKCFQLAEGL